MRIISGKYKGRIIEMPVGIRPTQDKVRKALFDILGDIKDLVFLELFAGSGAVGLEALSLGAKEVVFVESNSRCAGVIKDNLDSLKIQSPVSKSSLGLKASNTQFTATLVNKDIQDAIKLLAENKRKFDIIFLDPPYYKETAKKTLQTLGACDILTPDGFIVVQHFKKDNLPVSLGDLALFRQFKYGDTLLSLYTRDLCYRDLRISQRYYQSSKCC
jgi:16S rRNA (guanine(966)-N(2))-methyltransferase RsmD